MSVGQRQLLNKNWGCLFAKIWNLLTGIKMLIFYMEYLHAILKMLSYFIWHISIPSNQAYTANTLERLHVPINNFS